MHNFRSYISLSLNLSLFSLLENFKIVNTNSRLQALYHSCGNPHVTCNLYFCRKLVAVKIQCTKQILVSQINRTSWICGFFQDSLQTIFLRLFQTRLSWKKKEINFRAETDV